ncbi:MAG TPA: hypothetical protein PKE59_00410 [Novosphingobium sp.]|jgi:hypothetical protein|nr:hypothetical protein [Novosphingobium sp.]
MADFDCSEQIHDLVKEQLRDFCKWAAKNWRMEASDLEEIGKPPVYGEGYDAAVCSLEAALDVYTDDLGW